MRFLIMGALLLIGLTNFTAASFAQSSIKLGEGKKIFSDNCEVCHTIGSGDGVGPDLKGVTSRRKEEWLKSFIKHPKQMIEQKDTVALELLAKFKDPMEEIALTDEDVLEVIDYLRSASGDSVASAPGALKVHEKAATPKDIDKGKSLFEGSQRFLKQGPACISCHDVQNASNNTGGGLAKDLSKSYSKLDEAGISAILKKAPFPVMREAYVNKELTSEEITLLINFLANLDQAHNSVDYRLEMLVWGIVGFAVLLILYFILWSVGNSRRIK